MQMQKLNAQLGMAMQQAGQNSSQPMLLPQLLAANPQLQQQLPMMMSNAHDTVRPLEQLQDRAGCLLRFNPCQIFRGMSPHALHAACDVHVYDKSKMLDKGLLFLQASNPASMPLNASAMLNMAAAPIPSSMASPPGSLPHSSALFHQQASNLSAALQQFQSQPYLGRSLDEAMTQPGSLPTTPQQAQDLLPLFPGTATHPSVAALMDMSPSELRPTETLPASKQPRQLVIQEFQPGAVIARTLMQGITETCHDIASPIWTLKFRADIDCLLLT